MPSIIITSGQQQGQYLPLGRRVNIIGRAEALPMQVLDDMVSRKHFRIKYDENTREYIAEDLESRHGLFINQKKVTEPTVLKEGDHLLIGQTNLMFTEKDFDSNQSALEHYKKAGERQRPTIIQ